MLKRKCAALFFAAVLFFSLAAPVSAYFNRGTVTLSLGQSSVEVEKGKTAAVSVSIFPIKEEQLPGCGMAECPQTCGGTGCLNENGECTCGGTEYQTYYSTVTAVSSNTAVANVSYANGSLTVTGEGAGTATVTVTGSMRQYTDAETHLQVTVKEPEGQKVQNQSGGNAAVNNSDSAPSSGSTASSSAGTWSGTASSGGSGVTIAPVEGGTAADPANAGGSAAPAEAVPEEGAGMAAGADVVSADGSTVIETARGVYEIVQLSPATNVQAFLQSARDNSRFVTFQKKEGENVEYSWTFDGKKLTEIKPVNLIGEMTEEIPDSLDSLSGGEGGLLLDFEDNTLPGDAELYVRVSPSFADGTELAAQKLDENGKREVLAENIVVENGYATFSTGRIGQIVLAEKSAGNNLGMLGIIACLAAAAAAGGAFFLKGTKKVPEAGPAADLPEDAE